MKLADAQYEWNPMTWEPRGNTTAGDVIVYSRTEYLDFIKATGRRPHAELQFWNHRDKLPKWQALALMLVDFHTMVVRDGLIRNACIGSF